ncbi:MAG: serine/threonine protein kinase [Lachnospiraceae bacterium]|nr:serine/threonine protein kinase [Lachnospiraceae bacterium]
MTNGIDGVCGGVYFGGMTKEIEKGKVINGRYEVICRIGSGGTSRVYLVTDRHIGKPLAMKVLDRKGLGAGSFAKSEIEALRSVRYPLFPAIHDAFRDRDSIYILSEYVKGTALSEMCAGRGLGREMCLAVAEKICEALVYLHSMERPMFYLDLKPANIIIDPKGMPNLIDFGLAGMAARHMAAGTVGYSPPEQYRRDGHPDGRADIFALGMTYYAARSGVPPDPDVGHMHDLIRHMRIFSQSEKTFLLKCCAILPEDRYGCADEVLRQIRYIRSIPERIRKRTVITAVAAGVLLSAGYAASHITERIRQSESSAELVRGISDHLEGGEYTPEGIGIIKAAISAGNLPEETEQEFIFEVAVNSMLVSKDYKTAAAYFSKLDPEKYPEAEDYLKLCALQMGFDYDPAEALLVTGKLYADIAGRAPSKMKYENLIFIAGCYENYDADAAEGTAKAVSVLKMARDEIDAVLSSPEQEDASEIGAVGRRIDELSEVKRKRLRIRMNRQNTIGGTNEK